MTAKEKLLELVPRWSEGDAEIALRAVEHEHESNGDRDEDDEPSENDMLTLPERWRVMANGKPMPNVAAAVRRSRDGH
jgi:hypothetical protein